MSKGNLTEIISMAEEALNAFLATLLGDKATLQIAEPKRTTVGDAAGRSASHVVLSAGTTPEDRWAILLNPAWVPVLSKSVLGEPAEFGDAGTDDLMRELVAQAYEAVRTRFASAGGSAERSLPEITLALVPKGRTMNPEDFPADMVQFGFQLPEIGQSLNGLALVPSRHVAAATAGAGETPRATATDQGDSTGKARATDQAQAGGPNKPADPTAGPSRAAADPSSASATPSPATSNPAPSSPAPSSSAPSSSNPSPATSNPAPSSSPAPSSNPSHAASSPAPSQEPSAASSNPSTTSSEPLSTSSNPSATTSTTPPATTSNPSATTSTPPADSPHDQARIEVAPAAFPELGREIIGGDGSDAGFSLLAEVDLEVTVELGRRRIQLADVLRLTTGSVIELEKLVGEPLEVYANGRLIAEGEAVVMDEQFGIRITNLTSNRPRAKAFT